MKTILVVEDDGAIRELIRLQLTAAGYTTLVEADGESGLAAAKATSALAWAFPPDLILLDWMMPKMTGVDICRALRADPVTADVPVIMLTSKSRERDIEEGFAAGVNDYILKPFNPRSMLRRVEAVLAREGQEA